MPSEEKDIVALSVPNIIVAVSAGALPYSELLTPYFPVFLPQELHSPIAAVVGVLVASTGMELMGGKSLEPPSKLWKERFLLSAFLGGLGASMLSAPILNTEPNVAIESLASFAAVLGTAFSSYHLIN